jgi:radical SAM superfamily enzyme YgiQ (UPF0313 family)
LQKTDDKTLQKDHAEYFEQLVLHHTSGWLKVAPEHTQDRVVNLMRKPSFDLFFELKARFEEICERHKLNFKIIPYFISGHPGCTLADMANLALFTKQMGFRLDAVQDFTPTPGSWSTARFYTGLLDKKETVFVARTKKQKDEQRKFFFWYLPENRPWIRKTLDEDLHMGKLSRNLLSKEVKKGAS